LCFTAIILCLLCACRYLLLRSRLWLLCRCLLLLRLLARLCCVRSAVRASKGGRSSALQLQQQALLHLSCLALQQAAALLAQLSVGSSPACVWAASKT
jgi:hypothetical protein